MSLRELRVNLLPVVDCLETPAVLQGPHPSALPGSIPLLVSVDRERQHHPRACPRLGLERPKAEHPPPLQELHWAASAWWVETLVICDSQTEPYR